jgi:hypothetical protein
VKGSSDKTVENGSEKIIGTMKTGHDEVESRDDPLPLTPQSKSEDRQARCQPTAMKFAMFGGVSNNLPP